MEAGSRLLALLTIHRTTLGYRLMSSSPRQRGHPTHCVFSSMTYDLTAAEETQLARDLASDLDDYISNELGDTLIELAADILRRYGSDPGSDYGRDLIQDLTNRIRITAA